MQKGPLSGFRGAGGRGSHQDKPCWRHLLNECADDDVGRQIRTFYLKLYLLRHHWTHVGLSQHWKPRNLVMGFGDACNRDPVQSTISEKGDLDTECHSWTGKLCERQADPGPETEWTQGLASH